MTDHDHTHATDASSGGHRWEIYEVELVAPIDNQGRTQAADELFDAIRAAGFAVRRVQSDDHKDTRWGTRGEDYHV